MIAVELISRRRSAEATGPFGSRIPPEQPPARAAASRARPRKLQRMLRSRPLCHDYGGTRLLLRSSERRLASIAATAPALRQSRVANRDTPLAWARQEASLA